MESVRTQSGGLGSQEFVGLARGVLVAFVGGHGDGFFVEKGLEIFCGGGQRAVGVCEGRVPELGPFEDEVAAVGDAFEELDESREFHVALTGEDVAVEGAAGELGVGEMDEADASAEARD